jgi:penicillin-binding protein 2
LADRFAESLFRGRDIPRGFRSRVIATIVIVSIAFGSIALRVWHLQIRAGEQYRELSENNRVRLKRVRATRGLVFDRKGKVLVENRPSFDIVMVPEDAREPKEILGRLEGYVAEELPDARNALESAVDRPPFHPVVLRKDVDWPKIVAVETRQLELPGVSIRIGPRRSYPFGPLLAHLVGYIGEVNQDELARLEGYRMGDAIGKYGLEKHWEEWLRGETGGQQIEVDSIGRELRILREVEETPGATLHLTIDVDLQQAAYDALEGREGAVVALDPKDGAVLVLVSRPAFDSNLFAGGIRSDVWRSLLDDPLRPLNDKAVQGQYPPGSTFKIVVAAAALEERVISPSARIFCGGSIRFGNRDFRCWKKGGHGSVDLHRALVESCDVWFYQVGQRLGVDLIAAYSRKFGLGGVSGIRLDHEKAGTIPDSGWKRRTFGEPWYPGETLSVAIGQGYVTATPLQMANVAAVVASGGRRHRPHYVDRIELPTGEVVESGEENVVETGLQPATVAILRRALQDVVGAANGTGKNARVPGITVGGKTGTSQTVRLGKGKIDPKTLPRHMRDHAWFVSFAPVEAPEIAVAALVEHAGSGGGATAAPIVQKVLAKFFENRLPKPEDGTKVQQTALR